MITYVIQRHSQLIFKSFSVGVKDRYSGKVGIIDYCRTYDEALAEVTKQILQFGGVMEDRTEEGRLG